MMKKAAGDSTISPFGVYQPASLASGSTVVPNRVPEPSSSRRNCGDHQDVSP